MWYKGKKKWSSSKLSKIPTVDNHAECYWCKEKFNWRYAAAVVNGSGQEFCGDECFNKNRESSARLTGAIAFEDL